ISPDIRRPGASPWSSGVSGAGGGVAILVDLGSAVLTVKAMLAEGDELPENARLVDAPFVEGAVAAVVTASSGGDIGAVEAAASEAYGYRKT
ncbi:PTS-dependent dihydroxyacetone kinase phosphotransferase subunit DhaM, partial [Streptomyces rhizosphaericola]|uniref:PTS-dependent dihydroxyacetone kinase phosphotransferase subunit DhaM n=1 Tax=Streptomyces rhizosphaericola TaxID=2564098 RepID=UPI003B8A89C4